MKKNLCAILLPVLIIGVLGGCSTNKKANGAAQSSITASVVRGNMKVEVAGTGIVQPAETQDIKAVNVGIVNEVPVTIGQHVKVGESLVTFKSNDLSAKISNQKIQLEKLNLQLKGLNTSLAEERDHLQITSPIAGVITSVNVYTGDSIQQNTALLTIKDSQGKTHEVKAKTDGNVSGIDIQKGDKVATNTPLVQLASNGKIENQIQSLKLDIESANITLNSLEKQAAAPPPIKAQIDGQISKLTVSKNDQVKPGEVLGQVANDQKMQIHLAVDELDIPKVKMGQQVDITVNAFPSKVFKGKVIKIANEGTPINGVSTFDVTVSLDNAGKVKAGMSASANIVVTRKKNVLLLPIEAIQEKNNKHFVIVVGTQNTKRVPVQVGVHDANQIEITKGLKEGQKVMIPVYTTKNNQNKKAKFHGLKKMLGQKAKKANRQNKGGK